MVSSGNPLIRNFCSAGLITLSILIASPLAEGRDLLDRCSGILKPSGRSIDVSRIDATIASGEINPQGDYDFETATAELILELTESMPSDAEKLKSRLREWTTNDRLRIHEVQRSIHSGYRVKSPLGTYVWFSPRGGAKLQVDWPKGLALDERQKFLLKEKLLGTLMDLEYVKITQLTQLRNHPRRFFSANIELIRDRLLYSYLLHGNTGFTPPSGWKAETISTFKRLVLGTLLPSRFSALKSAKFNTLHLWVLENYGVRGLTRLLYFTHSPAIAIRYASTVFAQLQMIAAFVIASAVTPHIVDSYSFFWSRSSFNPGDETKKQQIEEVLRYFDLSKREVIQSVENTVDELPVPADPIQANVQAADRAKFKKLLKEIDDELEQRQAEPKPPSAQR